MPDTAKNVADISFGKLQPLRRIDRELVTRDE